MTRHIDAATDDCSDGPVLRPTPAPEPAQAVSAEPPAPLAVHRTPLPPSGPRGVRIDVAGDIDLAGALALSQHLHSEIDRGHDHTVVDLSRVRFLALAGVDALDAARAHARRGGGHLSIVNAPPAVQRLLDLVASLGVDFPLADPSLEHMLMSPPSLRAVRWTDDAADARVGRRRH